MLDFPIGLTYSLLTEAESPARKLPAMPAAMYSVRTVKISNTSSRELADKLVAKLATVLAPYDTYTAIAWRVSGSFDVGVQCPAYMEADDVVADVANWLLEA